MKIIYDEILLQKAKYPKSHKAYIQQLQQIVDKKEIFFKDFQCLGRIVDVNTYLSDNPNAGLNNKCTDVIYYMKDYVIQILASGKYYIRLYDSRESDEIDTKAESSSLQALEKILFDSLVAVL
jgi:hypothetical protein